MDNGLNGRYSSQLEKWNKARKAASRIVEAFYDETLAAAVAIWEEEFTLPSVQEVKSTVNKVVFLSSDAQVNKVARAILEWDSQQQTQPTTAKANAKAGA